MWGGARAAALAAGVVMGASVEIGAGAWAGPWTLEAGAKRAYLGLEARRAKTRFDAVGDRADGERWSGSLSLTLEYGLTDWATLGLKSEGRAALTDTDGVDGWRAGEAERRAWARTRLWRGETDLVSLQLGAAMPGSGATTSALAGLETEDDAAEAEGRLLWGRGWSQGPAIGWLAAEGAYRMREGDARDQLRLDLTAGARPRRAPRWLGLSQIFVTRAAGAGDVGDYDLIKLSAGVGYELTDGLTVVAGGVHEAAGRNIERGDSATLNLWIAY